MLLYTYLIDWGDDRGSRVWAKHAPPWHCTPDDGEWREAPEDIAKFWAPVPEDARIDGKELWTTIKLTTGEIVANVKIC